MKTTEQPMVQMETISLMSKPRRQDAGFGGSKSQPSPSSLSPIPIEWLDPDCWRLPSGKALAEFALQAGFLAPLMLGMSKPKRNPVIRAAQPEVQSGEGQSQTAAVAEDRGSRKLARESTRAASKRV